MNRWSVVYESAIRDDGSLFFPERLSHEFLQQMRRVQGVYNFANQYQNQIIPDEAKCFKSNWLRYYSTLPPPDQLYHFGFVDPAIGQKSHHDYTGIVVVSVDVDGVWYLRYASRARLTPTELVDQIFKVNKQFGLQGLGVETVAYQEALIYLLDQESRKRKELIPVKGVKQGQVSKETRILKLVPRFEWGRIYLSPGLTHFEDEYASFPRGSHDDLLDSLASLEELVFYPTRKEKVIERPNSPTDPNYERWYIQNLLKRRQNESE